MLFEIAVCAALGLLAILYNVYKFCKTKRTFFKDLGIPGPNPHPIYGNMPELFEMGSLKATEGWASKYGDIAGYFSGFRPVLIVRDPQLIKEIFIRKFDSFNAKLVVVELTSVTDYNVVKMSRLSGDKWREIKALTSPAFKSSMMRRAFPIIDECADEFLKIMKKTEGERVAVEISLPFCRLSMDILLRFLMGARSNVQMVTEQTEYIVNTTRTALRRSPYKWIVIFNVIPIWGSMKKFILFVRECFHAQPNTRVHEYFAEIVRLRKAKGWTGNEDLFQLLFNPEEKNGEEINSSGTTHSTDSGHSTNANTPRRRITPFEAIANAELFVVAGLEALTSALSFTTYLLAKHQDIQDKVREEVKLLLEKDYAVLDDHTYGIARFFGAFDTDRSSNESDLYLEMLEAGHFDCDPLATSSSLDEIVETNLGNINYDNISSLQYLNQVISESLRFYPPQPGLVNRRCQKNSKVNGLRIPKGTHIEVPVRLMHHDPRYWVHPEKFNPERFRPENKSTIEPVAYLPFGIGPRTCPASRFSELGLALIMAKTVAKYKLHLSDDLEKRNLKYVSPATLAFGDGGTWVRMEKI